MFSNQCRWYHWYQQVLGKYMAILASSWWYLVSMRRYWLVFGGTGSVWGGTGRYLVVQWWWYGEDEIRVQVVASQYGSENDVMEWLAKIKWCDEDSLKNADDNWWMTMLMMKCCWWWDGEDKESRVQVVATICTIWWSDCDDLCNDLWPSGDDAVLMMRWGG